MKVSLFLSSAFFLSVSLLGTFCVQAQETSYAQEMAQKIKETPDKKTAEKLAAEVIFLNPVVSLFSEPEKAGALLATLLELEPAQVGKLEKKEDFAPFAPQIERAMRLRALKLAASHYNFEALERSLTYLTESYPKEYAQGKTYLAQLKQYQEKYPQIATWIESAKLKDLAALEELVAFRLKALFYENPECDFKEWVAVRRVAAEGKPASRQDDRPANWQGISSMPGSGTHYRSEVFVQEKTQVEAPAKTVLSADRWVGHLNLHYDGQKLAYTSNQKGKKEGRPWDVYELDLASGKSENLTGHMPPDTDSYDSCYLPDGRLIFNNTSGFHGVPCVSGSDYVGNLHLFDPEKKSTRRLTLDQDNNWFPTMLEDGRVMFLRWEYTESAHYFSRILMHMNPDGSDQKEYYGSNSYWPNSMFNARPVPGKPGQFIAVVSGHHGQKRVGELVLFDINKGRKETEGALQKIPGFGQKVENKTKDELVNNIKTPYFAEPFPLSAQYFLAACNLKADNNRRMNIVLCDKFDNIVPLTWSEYFVYADPLVLKKTPRPTAIPDRVNTESKTSTIVVNNVYEGRAMEGVPVGKAKSVRVFVSEYSPRQTGSHYAMGMESNWDVKVLYGTVPINSDGSVTFEAPSNVPITVQVLDGEGKALALMRSWFTAMPGEILSCIGCHENQNSAPLPYMSQAAKQKPQKITPFQGPVRSFSFLNEVQPLLDKNCVSCHDGKKETLPNFADTSRVKGAPAPGSVSYWALHPFVRRNGPEGDYTGLRATEFSADTSELIQVLKKDHYGVTLSPEEWEKLYTWIDMNAPYLGEWEGKRNEEYLKRRAELSSFYAPATQNYEIMGDSKYVASGERKALSPRAPLPSPPVLKGFPFEVKEKPLEQEFALSDTVKMRFSRIPAGSMVMGSVEESPSEAPAHVVRLKKPFWMGQTEVTLEQYQLFEAEYKNGYYDMHYKDQVKPGYNMDENPQYPVIRVSWQKAVAFCDWLSQKIGKKVSLPSEEQWEYAARAGSATPFYFGELGADFSTYANLADVSIKQLAVMGVDPQPMRKPDKFYDFVPRDKVFDDKVVHLAPVGRYKPNAFGLYDMIGNVAEWTSSPYAPYGKKGKKGKAKSAGKTESSYVVRGGSWRDRPVRATASWRWAYPAWRPVYNVGFRVMIED